MATGSATLTYQWYNGIAPDTSSPKSGATAASCNTGSLTKTGNYWVRVTNPFGSVNSATAAVTVVTTATRPTITTQPVSISITSGSTATFSVAASGTSPTYQWYSGASGVTTTPISGATTTSFTTPALTSTTSYWVRATNAAGSADSTAATATVTGKASATVTLGSLAATYDGTAKSATATTTPSGLTVTFTYDGSAAAPTNAGTYAVVGTIANANYQGRANGSLTISNPPPSFGTWAANFEVSNGLTAGTIANHPDADFDHDGRSNLIEYAFGTSPVVANEPAPSMPLARSTVTHFVMQYQRDLTLTDLTFTAQASSDLATWKAPGDAGAPAGFTDSVIATAGAVETHEVKIPRSPGATVFMRVWVTQP